MGRLTRLATIVFLCAALPCASRESADYPPEYRVSIETLDNGTTIESFRWDSLTVVFEAFVDERYASTARVIDPSGVTLLELRSARFITPSLTDGGDDFSREFFLDLFGDGGKDLKLTAWSGGAYGCYTDMVYSYDRKRGLRNVLAYRGGEGRIGKGSDDLADDDELNAIARSILLRPRDGTVPQVVLADYGLHSLGGETHGSVVFVVLRWERDHYVVANEASPGISALAIERYRRRLEDALGDGMDNERRDGMHNGMGTDVLDSAVASDIVGYLSNAAMIGQYDQAFAWIREKLVGTDGGDVKIERERAFQRLNASYFERTKIVPRQIGESITVDQRVFLYLR